MPQKKLFFHFVKFLLISLFFGLWTVDIPAQKMLSCVFCQAGPTTEATALKELRDDRSPLALGLEWSSRITTVALEMVIPAIAGHWLDRQLGTRLLFLVLGALLGFAMGFLSLLRLTHPKPEREDPDD